MASANKPDMESLKLTLMKLFNEEIMAYLTSADDEETSPVSENIAQTFIDRSSEMILAAVTQMCQDYDEEGELNELANPDNDWIREYIYNGGELEEALQAVRT